MWRTAGLIALTQTVVLSQTTNPTIPIKLDVSDPNNITPINYKVSDISELGLSKKSESDFVFIDIGPQRIRENITSQVIELSKVGEKSVAIELSANEQDGDIALTANFDVYAALNAENIDFPDDIFPARSDTMNAKSSNSYCAIKNVHPKTTINIVQDGALPKDVSKNLVVENSTNSEADEYGLVTVTSKYYFINTSELADNTTNYSLKCVVNNYSPENADLSGEELKIEKTKKLNITGPPEIISFEALDSPDGLKHGVKGVIRCKVTAMPEPKVSIYKQSADGKTWDELNVSKDSKNNIMEVDFVITEVDIAKNFGNYKCQASNDYGNATPVSSETLITVTRKEYTPITSNASVNTLMECKTNAYPKPFSVNWREAGKTVADSTDFQYNEKTAEVNKVFKPEKIGSYECVMKLTETSDQVQVIYTATVTAAPLLSNLLSSPTYYIIVGSIIVLLIISVLIIVMLKKRSSGPPGSEAVGNGNDVASTTVAASSEHDLEKGNVSGDKGGTEEQAALMNNQV